MTTLLQNDILFDDRSLLEAALGENALKISSINANCDCSAHHSLLDDEAVDPHQITTSAASVN